MHPSFTPKTLSFLRSLKRNNDREWFRARKDDTSARACADGRGDRAPGRRLRPLCARARRVAEAVHLSHLPGHPVQRRQDAAEDPDSASFRWRAAARPERRSVFRGPRWVWMGGGFYAPSPRPRAHPQHISDTHPELHRLTRAPRSVARSTRSRASSCQSAAGFSKDDPAAGTAAPELPGRPRVPAGFATSAASIRRSSRPSRRDADRAVSERAAGQT